MKRRFFTLLCALSLAAGWLRADDPQTLAIGAAAPDFKLPGVDGKDYALADFAAAKVLVVVFTCNHCPTAQAYEERLKKLTADYATKGVAVVAISPNDPRGVRLDELGYTDLGDSFDDMKIRAKAMGFNFPYLYDGDSEAVSRAYGPKVTPHAFVFDAERKLRYAGRIDDGEVEAEAKSPDLRNAIEALLAGKLPAPEQTKVFGCSIKWAGKQAQVAAFMEKLAKEPVNVELADAAALAEVRKGDGVNWRLVNVWATWCGPCVAEFDDLVEINRMYRNRDFQFIAVSANRPEEKDVVQRFLMKKQASNKNLLFASKDRDALLAALDDKANGALPLTLLVSPKGEVVFRKEGAIEPLELKRAIVNALGRMKLK